MLYEIEHFWGIIDSHKFRDFLEDESGAETVEYIMITLGVLVFVVASVAVFGVQLNKAWGFINGFLQQMLEWNGS
ncbi:MAG: hypothetical protein HY326_12405 [Chloroflexi bacterium]|nr:hypothetical protein [Chloroflexota bacterium]